MNAFDREEKQLEDDFENGLISASDYHEQMRELQRDYREAAEEAALDAYERELSCW